MMKGEESQMKDLTSKPAGQVAGKSTGKLAEFMARVKDQPHRGRLAFIIDATGSREATWDLASQLQSEMFESARKMAELMGKISCRGGSTQIERDVTARALAPCRYWAEFPPHARWSGPRRGALLSESRL
jgi:hypothetical protein